jgi:hypothetical protein
MSSMNQEVRSDMKVPLRIGWLSEEGLLDKALQCMGQITVPGTATETGIRVLGPTQGELYDVLWDEYLNLTLDQLKQIGFE